jgi:uncharacterized membrane protein YdbT with pleckstrin-like domain
MEEFELEPGEQIIRTIRKHWIIFVIGLLPYLILGILPLFIPTALALFAPTHALTNGTMPAIADFLVYIWWLFLWIAAFGSFIRYFLNQWIITTTRIVDIEQHGFFDRQVSSFLLARVQDVTTNVSGVLATIFGFGSIDVETAGRDEKFIMHGLGNPEEVRDLIMREVAELHEKHGVSSDGV